MILCSLNFCCTCLSYLEVRMEMGRNLNLLLRDILLRFVPFDDVQILTSANFE